MIIFINCSIYFIYSNNFVIFSYLFNFIIIAIGFKSVFIGFNDYFNIDFITIIFNFNYVNLDNFQLISFKIKFFIFYSFILNFSLVN